MYLTFLTYEYEDRHLYQTMSSVFLRLSYTICKKKIIHQQRRHEHNIIGKYITLSRYLQIQELETRGATGGLHRLLISLQTALKVISTLVRKAGITQIFGTSGQTNIQGEEVKKLDLITNDLFINLLTTSYASALLISEELDDPVEVAEHYRGKYIVCFDPLDGSSNFECAAPIGSIFSILRKQTFVPTIHDALQPGNKVAAAGYALYGSTTLLVLSVGHGVQGFMLDPSIGEFLLFDRNIKIPEGQKLYSANEGYQKLWDKNITDYLDSLKSPKNGSPWSSRYIGSLVADVHRLLKYGGIFLHPGSFKNPKGKLRLLYECIPVSYIVNQAGGIAIDGSVPILDIQPTDIHQRSTLYLGCKKNMAELQKYLSKSPQK